MSNEPEGTGWTWRRKGCRVIDGQGRKVAEVNASYCDEAELNRRGLTLAASKDLLAALQGLLDDFQQMVSDPELLKMAMELARSGRPLDFESDGGPDTVRQARAAIARAVEVGK